MPIDVDRSHAPRFLRYTFTGPAPSPHDQAELRASLIATGDLTEDTAALMDVRGLTVLPTKPELLEAVDEALRHGGLPRRLAYVALPGLQLPMTRLIQDSVPATMTIAVFFDETAALTWLLDVPPVDDGGTL